MSARRNYIPRPIQGVAAILLQLKRSGSTARIVQRQSARPDSTHNDTNPIVTVDPRARVAGPEGTRFRAALHTRSNRRTVGVPGQTVVLVFYPADWSPVCGDQIAVYNEMKAEFDEYHAQLARHFR